jgi:hypothetical protein
LKRKTHFSYKCIGVYSLDLEDKIPEHYVEDEPLQIRITADMACVLSERTENDQKKWTTRFYKLPWSELVIEHDLAELIFAHQNSWINFVR